MSTTQILETIRQLPIKEQKYIANIILQEFANQEFNADEEEIRKFVSNSDAFDFWKDEREDIYQDYLTSNFQNKIQSIG